MTHTALQLLCAAGRFQDALPYFACVEPVALFNKDILQPYIGLFFSAGAEIYRRCDMPSHALDCLRKALAVYRCAPVDVCRDAECVRDLELWMRVAGLSVSVDRVTDEIEKTEARIKARVDRVEPLPPSVYRPSHLHAMLPVWHAALMHCSATTCPCQASSSELYVLFIHHSVVCVRLLCKCLCLTRLTAVTQIPRTQMMKIPAETLLPQPATTLSRVPATKLQMQAKDKEAEAGVIKKCEQYAVMGSTLLLRASPLPSQPLLQLAEGAEVDMPQKRGLVMPELKLRISYAEIPARQTALSSVPVFAQHL